MSLFPIVTPFIVVAVVLGVIAGIGNILLAVRAAIGGEQASLFPVIVALSLAALITAGAFVISGRGDRGQRE